MLATCPQRLSEAIMLQSCRIWRTQLFFAVPNPIHRTFLQCLSLPHTAFHPNRIELVAKFFFLKKRTNFFCFITFILELLLVLAFVYPHVYWLQSSIEGRAPIILWNLRLSSLPPSKWACRDTLRFFLFLMHMPSTRINANAYRRSALTAKHPRPLSCFSFLPAWGFYIFSKLATWPS